MNKQESQLGSLSPDLVCAINDEATGIARGSANKDTPSS